MFILFRNCHGERMASLRFHLLVFGYLAFCGVNALCCLFGVFRKMAFFNWLIGCYVVGGFKLHLIFLICQVMVWHC